MPYRPTDEQQRIVEHDSCGHARVLAGPGTGKSATLVALVDRLMAGNPAPRIKLLTFTRAATAELAKKVSDHPAAAAERPSTIHSFSISVLLRNPGTGDFPKPLRIADDYEDANIVYPTLARRIGIRVTRLNDLIREMAANWESLVPEENSRVDPAHRALFNGAWGEHRQVYGYTLLAELPYSLLHALRNHPDLEGADFELLIVDEYQDLNACDLGVLRSLADRGCSIIGAGDDDQSIYAFRRAAPEGIRRFSDDYPHCGDYALSISQRCGSRIIEWATYVIEGDPDRPHGRPPLRPAEGSPPGEVALLAFADEAAEALGVADLVRHLLNDEQVAAEDILILLRGDHNGHFSRPIKEALHRRGIEYSDPDAIDRVLAETANRRMLATFRLLVNPSDSLAWATLLRLNPGTGETFSDYIYDRARAARTQFGEALLDAFANDFAGAPRSSASAAILIRAAIDWLAAHQIPNETPEAGWGHWMVASAGEGIVPAPTEEFTAVLQALDERAEPDRNFGRFLSQITPLAKDIAYAECRGVRIMTMMSAKGLTVRATIVVGAEEGITPHPECDLQEERRLMYVALTRAREYQFVTWARRRTGPTARVGGGQVRNRRLPSQFFNGGPVASQDGAAYLQRVQRP